MLKRTVIFISVLFLAVIFCLQGYCLEKSDISAASAVLYYPEYDTVLFEKNSHEKRSMASTTKIMTSLIALEMCAPSKVVKITDEMVDVEGTSSGLSRGDMITLKDLVYCMLLESGNDAANAVALELGGSYEDFASLMNKRAAQIGMKNTSFVTPSGLDGENHYTTAYDMSLLAASALQNIEFVEISRSLSEKISFVDSDKSVTLYNHNKLLDSYEGCIGMKTGFTKKSGRCLVSAAERNGITLIAVTLNASDDWNDHKKMLDYGFSCIEQEVADTDFSAFSVRVAGGDKKYVNIDCPEVFLNITQNNDNTITRKLYLEKFLYAPVEKGEKIGFVEFYNGGKLIKTVPLTAKDSVSASGIQKTGNIKDRLYSLFDGWWKNG